MHNYDLVIFDMDGTLIDSDKAHIDMFEQFWGKFFPQYCGKGIMENGKGKTVLQIFLDNGIKQEQTDEIFDKLNLFYQTDAADAISTLRFFDGAHETIQELKNNGIKVAMVSNSMHELVQQVVAKNQAQDLFCTAIGAHRDAKDKAERFRLILEETGVSAQRTLYVGDSELDVAMAHACDMDCCIIYTPYAWVQSVESLLKDYDPDFIVKKIYNVNKIVL